MYWTETYGGQLLSGPKLIKSCSVYQEEKDVYVYIYEGWNFNSGNYLFTTDTK